MPAVPPHIIGPIRQQFSALLPKPNIDHPLGCQRARIPDRTVFEKLAQVLVSGLVENRRRVCEEVVQHHADLARYVARLRPRDSFRTRSRGQALNRPRA